MPRGSVIRPVFSGMPYNAEAVESVLSRSLPDLELMVMDDGSTEAAREIAARFRLPSPSPARRTEK